VYSHSIILKEQITNAHHHNMPDFLFLLHYV
jgi:hypothetical protein